MFAVANNFFDRCISNMISTLRENNLTDEFMDYCPSPETGYMFADNAMITRLADLVSDGHSGSSFAMCCRAVRDKLIERRRQRARFKGLVRAIVAFRRLRLSASERVYAPPSETGDIGGDGYIAAEEDFTNRVIHNEGDEQGLTESDSDDSDGSDDSDKFFQKYGDWSVERRLMLF